MRKINYLFAALLAMGLMGTFNACSEDDPEIPAPQPEQPVDPEPEPEPEPEPPVAEAKFHFDIFVTIDKHGGMSTTTSSIAKSVKSLAAEEGVISMQGIGSELNDANGNIYSLESIVKGQYYYQVPTSNDRFTKFRIIDNKLEVAKEQRFVGNTYTSRQYTHAWLDDDQTLLIVSTNGDKNVVLYTKLNAEDLSIIEEGTLDIPLPESEVNGQDCKALSTSGILTFNPAVSKLFYFYFGKNAASGRSAKTVTPFYTAVIDPVTMKVESNKKTYLAEEPAGSAYGELMQNTVMYDEENNLYLAAWNDTEAMEEGHLLRINAGEIDFDENYEGYKNPKGKLLTIQYLGDKKALIYAREDALGTSIQAYSHYYAILDLESGQAEPIKYNGQEIDYSAGRFSQRTAVVDGKAYIGTNTEKDTNAIIYIYDIATGEIEKGAEVDGSYYFDILRVVDDAE